MTATCIYLLVSFSSFRAALTGGCVLLDVPGLSLALTNKLGIDAAKAVVVSVQVRCIARW